MSINLNEGSYAYVLAQTALLNCRVAGMVAENAHRASMGSGPAFTEEHFDAVEREFTPRISHNAICELART